MMNVEAIIKALSNRARWQIVQWLKQPKQNFASQVTSIDNYGVCSGRIQEKLTLSQSTTSHYLKTLEQCGLLIAKRHGQWTFYQRNEAVISEFKQYIHKNL